MNDIKYCEDCKHSTRSAGKVALHCSHPDLVDVFALVYRKPDPDSLPFCVVVRDDAKKCGSSGMFFEAKPTKTPRKWWQFWL